MTVGELKLVCGGVGEWTRWGVLVQLEIFWVCCPTWERHMRCHSELGLANKYEYCVLYDLKWHFHMHSALRYDSLLAVRNSWISYSI